MSLSYLSSVPASAVTDTVYNLFSDNPNGLAVTSSVESFGYPPKDTPVIESSKSTLYLSASGEYQDMSAELFVLFEISITGFSITLGGVHTSVAYS